MFAREGEREDVPPRLAIPRSTLPPGGGEAVLAVGESCPSLALFSFSSFRFLNENDDYNKGIVKEGEGDGK
jgi:hypothetical protein